MSSTTTDGERKQKITNRVLQIGFCILLAGWIISLGASFFADHWLPPPSEDISQTFFRDLSYGNFMFPFFYVALFLDLLAIFLSIAALSTGISRYRAFVLILISTLSLTWHSLAVIVYGASR